MAYPSRRVRNRRFVERKIEEVNPSQNPDPSFPALFSGRSMDMVVSDYNWAALFGCPFSLAPSGRMNDGNQRIRKIQIIILLSARKHPLLQPAAYLGIGTLLSHLSDLIASACCILPKNR